MIYILKDAVMITVFVFVMMLLVDFIDTASKKRMSDIMKRGQWRQYILSSFLGSTPGCLGAFMNVSLYVHGIIGFGAIVGGMIATSGDEAFVMLIKFPRTALILFILLFLSGIIFGWISDKVIKTLRIGTCKSCLEADCEYCIESIKNVEDSDKIYNLKNIRENFYSLSFTRFILLQLILCFMVLVLFGILGPTCWDWKHVTLIGLGFFSLIVTVVASEHYLHSHIWEHIIRRHLLKVFLWSFGSLLFVHWGLDFWNLDTFIDQHILLVLVIGALLGIMPESGPHLVFVIMYAEGLAPFSVLFTTSFVQDGHGMLPLLSYSIKDSVIIKFLNLFFGLAIGVTLFAFGL
ncbi:putative manganese transporter [Thermodesulfobacteriota bacterium]